MTKQSATALAGLGLMGVAKDTYPHDGDTYSFVAGFAEVEVDRRNRQDAPGRLPRGRRRRHRRQPAQPARSDCSAASTWASATRCSRSGSTTRTTACRWRKRFYHNKPLTILDIPAEMRTEALGLADPETPVGARGVGEPPVGAGYGSVMNAIADAVGEESVPARAGDRRHRADVARAREANARSARVAPLTQNRGASLRLLAKIHGFERPQRQYLLRSLRSLRYCLTQPKM